MKNLLLILGFIFLAWLGGLLWFISIVPTQPLSPDVRADAIIVLTGGRLRMEHGFDMLDEQAALQMLISGVGKQSNLAQIVKSMHDKVRDYRKYKDNVTLGYKADDTTSNAAEAASWMAQNNFQSLRLVTAHYHTPRSLLEFHKAMPGKEIIADPVFPEEVKLQGWWLYSGTRWLLLSEYHKYIAVMLRQKLDYY